ncbi:MAG: hypothetical protein ABIG70_02915 [Pseudomonadota bacterium]
MDYKFALNSMPAFWLMLTGALLALFWALVSGVPLGGWMLAFVLTAFVARLVYSLLGWIGIALYGALVSVAFISYLMS